MGSNSRDGCHKPVQAFFICSTLLLYSLQLLTLLQNLLFTGEFGFTTVFHILELLVQELPLLPQLLQHHILLFLKLQQMFR